VKLEIRGAEKLSFRGKQAVILKETGHSNEAIAKRMGVNTATVATLLSRARSKGYEVVIIISTTLGIYGAENEENEEEV
jgi:DNA-directed RNA polymerase specialized sigma24 family protein